MHKLLAYVLLLSPPIARSQKPATKHDTAPSITTASIAAIRAELEAMFDTDQLHRRTIIDIEKRHGRSSSEVIEAWAKQNGIDAQNIRRLEQVIAQYGWPGSTQFGSKAATAAFLILQHSDVSYQKRPSPRGSGFKFFSAWAGWSRRGAPIPMASRP